MAIYLSLILLGVVIAWIGGYKAWKRGLTGWAWAAFLTGPIVVVGPVVGIMAMTREADVTGPIDEPCPGCGHTLGHSRRGTFDRSTEQRVASPATALISGVLGAALLVGGLLLALSVWRGGDKSCSGAVCLEWEHGAGIAGISFLVIGLWLGSAVGSRALAFLRADRVPGTGYRCAGCNHQWTRLKASLTAA
ncbi:MAG: hypothetical protein WEE36_05985 [Acidimicrobiia bacterium]